MEILRTLRCFMAETPLCALYLLDRTISLNSFCYDNCAGDDLPPEPSMFLLLQLKTLIQCKGLVYPYYGILYDGPLAISNFLFRQWLWGRFLPLETIFVSPFHHTATQLNPVDSR